MIIVDKLYKNIIIILMINKKNTIFEKFQLFILQHNIIGHTTHGRMRHL